jgi:hydrogenase maturation protease
VRILVAGLGNVLRGDDGFGVAVAQRLAEVELPEDVRVLELGIGGIHLVQELLEPVDALIVVDAVDLRRPPGTVLVIRPDVTDVHRMTLRERHDHLADMHYATPERALMLARGLGVLPPRVLLVGCQPVDAERVGEGLTPEVADAVDVAVEEIRRVLTSPGGLWDQEGLDRS